MRAILRSNHIPSLINSNSGDIFLCHRYTKKRRWIEYPISGFRQDEKNAINMIESRDMIAQVDD